MDEVGTDEGLGRGHLQEIQSFLESVMCCGKTNKVISNGCVKEKGIVNCGEWLSQSEIVSSR